MNNRIFETLWVVVVSSTISLFIVKALDCRSMPWWVAILGPSVAVIVLLLVAMVLVVMVTITTWIWEEYRNG